MTRLLDEAELVVSTPGAAVAFERELGWTRFLSVHGRRAYHLGGLCDTCELVFERLESAAGRVSPGRMSESLRAGLDRVEEETIQLVGEVLPPGRYRALLLELEPTLVSPGEPGDYFVEEQVALWGTGRSGIPHDPGTAYYRAVPRPVCERNLLLPFLVPLVPAAGLHEPTIARFEESLARGERPTALAVSVLEVCGPADLDEEELPVEVHWGLVQFLLDGHHKTAAAARAGRPLTVLSLLALDESKARPHDFRPALAALAG